jgi:hypothetical protein
MWEGLCSTLGRDTGYPDWGFKKFYPVPSVKFWNENSIRPWSFPSIPFPIHYSSIYLAFRSRDSLVDIATGYDRGEREFESRQGKNFSLLHIVQTGSGVHPTSYKMGTGGKAAGAWSWPLTSN